MGLVDWLVPPPVRIDQALSERFRGIVRALLLISAVVLVLALTYLAVMPAPPLQELALFATVIVVPVLGALLVRVTANITLSLLLTNLAGVCLTAGWSFLSGGILSPAAPWMMALMAVWAAFGNRLYVLLAGGFVSSCIVVLYLVTVNHAIPVSMMPPDRLPLYALLSLLSATSLLVIAAQNSLAGRERVKRRMQAARQEAEQANRAKNVFLSSMSHELRTPLSAVVGYAEILALEDSDKLSPAQREYVRKIEVAGEQLMALVNQVLDVSRVESGSLHLEFGRVAPAGVIESAIARLAATTASREVQVTADVAPARDCAVWADGARLEQVLWNLLSNAIKFNHPGGQVRIEAHRVSQPGVSGIDRLHGNESLADNEPLAGGERVSANDRLRIVVTDTGRGITPAYRGDVFQPFARLGAEGGGIEGAGLGLSFSQRVTNLMGGEIGFAPNPLGGSLFWVEFPLIAGAIPLAGTVPKPL